MKENTLLGLKKDEFIKMLEVFNKYDNTVYFEEQVSFQEAFDNEDSTSLKNYTNSFYFSSKILSSYSELKKYPKSQKEFIIWTCGSFFDLIKEWCPHLPDSGISLAINAINRIEEFHDVVQYQSNNTLEKKKEVVGASIIKPIIPKSDIYDWLGYYFNALEFESEAERDKLFEAYHAASEWIRRRLIKIKDNLSSTEKYRNTEYHTKLMELRDENTIKESSVLSGLFDFLFNPSKIEIFVMDFFWKVIEQVYDKTRVIEIDPDNFLSNFSMNRIHLTEDEGLFQFEEEKPTELSVPQKLRIIHALGIDKQLSTGLGLSQTKTSLVLAAIFGATPRFVQNELSGLQKKLNSNVGQTKEDRKMVNKVFTKAGLNQFVVKVELEDKT